MTPILSLLQAAGQVVQNVAAAVPEVVAKPTDNPYATLGLGVLLPFAMQALKNATWFPFISRASSKVNFAVGVVLAIFATAGVHFTYDVASGGTITIPSLHALFQAMLQWATQQAAYKGFVVPAETLGEIRTMLARAMTPPPVSEGQAKGDAAERQP